MHKINLINFSIYNLRMILMKKMINYLKKKNKHKIKNKTNLLNL